VLNWLAPLTHRLRVFIETLLPGFEHVLMLPSLNAPLVCLRTLRLERAVPTRGRPIMAQRPAVLLVRITIGQLLPRRTAIHILDRQIDKVLLAVAAVRLRARGPRLRQRHGNIGFLASHNLGAVEVSTIANPPP